MNTENKIINDTIPATNDAAPKLSRREAMKRMAKTVVGVCAASVSNTGFTYGIYVSGNCVAYYSYEGRYESSYCGISYDNYCSHYYSHHDYYSVHCNYDNYNNYSNYSSYSSYNSYCSNAQYCSTTGPKYYSVSLYCSGAPQYCSATHYHSAPTYCSTSTC